MLIRHLMSVAQSQDHSQKCKSMLQRQGTQYPTMSLMQSQKHGQRTSARKTTASVAETLNLVQWKENRSADL
jgi:hypothetical protein